MSRPAILNAINVALVTHEAKGILASANEAMFHECAALLPDQPSVGRLAYTVGEDTVLIARSLAQLPNGWVVRTNPKFERDERLQPRDPETGRYLPYPEESE